MFRLLLLTLAAAFLIEAQRDPGLTKILSDRRSHSIAGDFKVQYKQEDGTTYSEAVDHNNTRYGSYSYVDTNGKLIQVEWEAGPQGFRILKANNLPQGPAPQPQPLPQPPRPQFQPQPQFQPEPQPQFQPQPQPQFQPQPRPRRPRPQPKFRPRPRPQPQEDFSFGNQFQQEPFNNNHIQPDQRPFVFNPTTTTTRAPRIFPKGNLELTRTNEGYSYSFSSN